MTIIHENALDEIADAVICFAEPMFPPDGKVHVKTRMAFLPEHSLRNTMPKQLRLCRSFSTRPGGNHFVEIPLTIRHIDTIDGVYIYSIEGIEGEETK